MNAFDNYLAIIYKDSKNKSFRILIDKLTLTFISKTKILDYYDGIYSKKFGIFYSKNTNRVNVLYKDMENSTPNYASITFTVESKPMEFLFAAGESRFITLFQGSPLIKIRKMINYTQISQFATFTTINLASSEFQCYCLNS